MAEDAQLILPTDGHRNTGWSLFWQQTRALLLKNALLAWRNKASTFLQLFASFFFILLVFAVTAAVNASISSITSFQNLYDPTPVPIPGIPACQSGTFMRSTCYDFLWTGNWSSVITSLVQNISTNNPGRPIDFQTQTLGFATPDDVNAWLLQNPYMTPGVLIFTLNANGTISYGLQTNSTAKQQRGQYEDPTFTFQVPMQASAEREITRHLTQNWDLEWTPSYAEFPHPAIELLGVVAQTAAVFLFAASMFNFVIQISNIVMEKENKLRQAMSTMGLLDSVYWLTWGLWELALSLVACLLLVCFGLMFQFDFFLHNGFGTLFFMFFLFWVCMTSVAFFVSVFLRKSSSANTIGFSIFIVGFILQLIVVFGFPYDQQFAAFWRVLFSLFPPNLLAIGLKFLGDATATPDSPGIALSQTGQCAPYNAGCVITVAGVYAWLLCLTVIYFLLAIYLDNVIPDANGVRKPVLFFLSPSFWTGKSKGRKRNMGLDETAADVEDANVDKDVAEEELRVREGLTSAEQVALSVLGLQKVFKGKRGCCGCGKKKPDFHAVKGAWFEMEKETLLCLLGPNGAGKSTTINCLTGILPVSAGDGLIYGRSVSDPSQMSVIRRTMGVCPQFDVLWDRLSGRDHLYLFARIKGLPEAQIPKEVTSLLDEVRLEEAAAVRSGSYSGGMKRRLSVAVSLIGNPSIVFLDEPTTGMDPVSRRYVWDIIERAKRGRAIVLTTHSMEEADILGDRIAIMAKGKLRCIGTSIHLKQRFGSGMVVTVGLDGAGGPAASKMQEENGEQSDIGNHVAGTNGHANGGMRAVGSQASLASEADLQDARERVKVFFLESLGVEPSEESRGYLKFNIPRSLEDQGEEGEPRASESDNPGTRTDSRLTSFFRELRSRRRELGVSDVQLSLTTLEEVFLNIARMAELETAASEGRYDTFVLSNGTTVKVPVGAERVFLPSLGHKRKAAQRPRGNQEGQEDQGHEGFQEAGSQGGGWVVSVEWQQDDSGNLRIFRTSDPVPATAEERAAAEGAGEDRQEGARGGAKKKGLFGRKQETIVARVIDGEAT